MMDSPNFMPYVSRTSSSTPVQRPSMATQYGVAEHYSSSMTTVAAPQSIPAPHYSSHHSYAYGSYPNPSPVPAPGPALAAPFKQEYPSRTHHRHQGIDVMDDDAGRVSSYHRDIKAPVDYQAPSPASTRSVSVSSTGKSLASVPNANAKTITLNQTTDPSNQAIFDTRIDQLMKVIQQSDKRTSQQCTPVQSPKSEGMAEGHSPPSPGSVTSAQNSKESKKKYVCEGPGCNKRFSQKTHLVIHTRTHTGVKPFVCPYPDCGLTFSQKGNLRTHERRHTGDRPYKCRVCHKGFAQKGNVRSHEETHKMLKPYKCRLDNCNKDFSQLGNMKTHQNAYHSESLAKLTDTFMRYAGADEIPPQHRDMFEYFKEHYKNSNKGIKGRGKDRTIDKTKSKSGHKTSSRASSTPQYQHSPPLNQERNSQYAVAQAPPNMINSMPRSHASQPYMMETMDHEQHHQHHPSHQQQQDHASPSHLVYGEETSRPMGYPERLY